MKNFEQEILQLLKDIKITLKNKSEDNYILENTYFLKNGNVLSLERKNGVSRFPYGHDGFTLWAYSSGYISINESTFYLVLPSPEGREPYLAFFLGEDKKGKYFPYSILGGAKNPEEKNIKRYTVYSKECVYYLLETSSFLSGCRIYVTEDKKVSFTVFCKNKTNKLKHIYLSSYMNCLFKYANGECMETKWFKKCSYNNDIFSFESPEDIDRHTHIDNYGIVKREFVLGNLSLFTNTTSKKEFNGSLENSLVNSISLKEGTLKKQKKSTLFTDTAIEGDINQYNLNSKEWVIINYVMAYAHNLDEYTCIKNNLPNFQNIEEQKNKEVDFNKNKYSSTDMLNFEFEGWKDKKVNTTIFNQFLKYVIYQTEYCGLAKNSGAMFLGVRDVMQQVEAALIWNPKACRRKILEVLSFIDSSGNPPRQYSIPPKNGAPLMDLRDFIDQGVWIISTIYTYLSYTKDYSILEEKIGYYDRKNDGVVLSSRIDSVLDHMIQIMNYLIEHIDNDTNCLRAMYGDWNDALDGLGISSDPKEKYGNGVSIMATLQLYSNLQQMIEILEKLHVKEDLVELYKEKRELIKKGVKDNAVVEKDGIKKIVHGWGKNQSYYVGSFCDVDNKSRSSLTANAFYVISKMNEENYLDKNDLLLAFSNLDSKYGFKTFEPYFEKNCKGVGRIINLPKGTAENGATYIHGTLFGILACFYLNEEKMAYDQLEKILPFTHEILTTTPCVMPNSYSYNVEEGMDGESMSDWYTGSANTLIKTLIKGSFGIEPNLNGVNINIKNYYPSEKCRCSLKVNNTIIVVSYRKENLIERNILLNGKKIEKNNIFIGDDMLDKTNKISIEIVE